MTGVRLGAPFALWGVPVDGRSWPDPSDQSRRRKWGLVAMEGMGIGIGAIGVGVGPVPMGAMGGLNGPLGASPGQTGQPAQLSTIQQQQLSQLLEGLSSADLLLALMVAAGSSRCRKKDDDSGAMAILAGLAMASRISGGGLPQGPPPPIQDWSNISGQALNITA